MRASLRVIPLVILAALGLLCLGGAPSGDARAVAAPPAPPCWTGSWQQAAAYPIPNAFVAVTSLGSQIYGFGGGGDYQNGRSAAYRYDPATDAWTRLADVPQALTGMSAVGDGSGIYLLNGSPAFGSAPPVAALYRYDPGANTYTALAPPPLATAEQAAVYLDGKIYRIGGDTGQGPTARVDVYSIATNTWAPAGTVAPYPEAGYGLAAVSAEGVIYAGGGVAGSTSSHTYRYDPASNAWSDAAVADFPAAFALAASAVLDGRWVVAGGYQDAWASAHVWALDLTDPRGGWVNLPALSEPRRGAAGVALGSAFYAVAGEDILDHETAGVSRYDELPCPAATPTITGTPPTATATASPAPSCPPVWQAVPVPAGSPIVSVAATGPGDAWAVDSAYTGTRMLHWDGSVWRAFPAPPVPDAFGVAASGRDDVWVAGTTATGAAPAVAHWDGAAWQAVCCTADATAEHSEVLSGIAVSAPGDAWAVGVIDSSGADSPLVFHCMTAGCTGVADPPAATGLQAVSAPAPDDVWVAGWQHMAPNPPANISYLARWDGSWTALTCPDIGPLDGVAATGPDSVWALNSGHSGSLLHWDGQACHEVALAAPASAVVALAPNDAWAAGSVFQHWDGTAWQVVPGVSGLQVAALAAAGPADVWAVGQDAQGQAASAHYSVPPAFADVPVTQPFYGPIEDLACRSLVSGYSCGGPGEPCVPPANLPYYRVGASVTRGQVTKMVVLAEGWPLLTPAVPTFADVPRGQPFYAVIETAAAHGIISGYACGGPGEPCDAQHRPYFRPYANVTRGQIAKIVVLGAGYPIPAPPTPTFADVPAGQPFYGYVEAAAAAGLISGYTCGGPGEPCDAQHRPYFRPGASATRGQTAKIVDLSLASAPPGGP